MPLDISCVRCTGFLVVRRLFGSGMLGLLVEQQKQQPTLFMSFVGVPGLSCVLYVQSNTHELETVHCSALDIDGAIVESRTMHWCVGENETRGADGWKGSNTLADRVLQPAGVANLRQSGGKRSGGEGVPVAMLPGCWVSPPLIDTAPVPLRNV